MRSSTSLPPLLFFFWGASGTSLFGSSSSFAEGGEAAFALFTLSFWPSASGAGFFATFAAPFGLVAAAARSASLCATTAETVVDFPLVFAFGAAEALGFCAGELFFGELEVRLLERSDFLTPTGYLFLGFLRL